jgi:uncharacterized membrane protein
MFESPAVRFWEVDMLRGWAVVMMVFYHLAFDLNYFAFYDIDVSQGFWLAAARLAASLFLLLVGLSLTLSRSRALRSGQDDRYCLRLMRRSARMLGLALGITVVTYLFIGRGFIVFGVLHLIGLSLLPAYLFLQLHRANLIFGLFFILIGAYLQSISVGFSWLLWLGLAPHSFYSVDYFPVFPWFGVILVGMGLGDWLYPCGRRRISLPDIEPFPFVRLFTFLGKNSLGIYLIHQPVIISFLQFTVY